MPLERTNLLAFGEVGPNEETGVKACSRGRPPDPTLLIHYPDFTENRHGSVHKSLLSLKHKPHSVLTRGLWIYCVNVYIFLVGLNVLCIL